MELTNKENNNKFELLKEYEKKLENEIDFERKTFKEKILNFKKIQNENDEKNLELIKTYFIN